MFRLYAILWNGFKQSTRFEGRATRRDFWPFFALVALLYFAAVGADVTYFASPAAAGFGQFLSSLFGGEPPIVKLFYILFALPVAAFVVRRLHDLGLSGWYGLAFLIPFLGILLLAASLGRRGSKGVNQFGYDPRFGEKISIGEWQGPPVAPAGYVMDSMVPAE